MRVQKAMFSLINETNIGHCGGEGVAGEIRPLVNVNTAFTPELIYMDLQDIHVE